MFSISLFKMALTNSNTKAVQTIRIMSTPGILSVRPFITAIHVGTVAQCKTNTATQPIASALIWLNFSAKNVFIPVTNLSNCSKNFSIIKYPYKRCVDQSVQSLAFPILDLHNLHDSTWHFLGCQV